MSEKEKLLSKLRGVDFAMWELHIFLDTHPDDKDAMMLLNKYKKKREVLVTEYQSKYGPLNTLDVTTDNRWEWINSPWPWETSEGEEH